jgi:hypothetical protein
VNASLFLMTGELKYLKPLLALALLFTLLDCVKPLCIDDALYYARARQVAEHPLDPYGFRIFWNDRPEPALQVLAPPLFPYWWAAAIRLFGDRPVLWKLWLLPVSLLLVFSLHALYRRFARGHEMLLTWLTVLSPVFLPSFNLMLDVPVVALSLCALNLLFRAVEGESLRLATCAGLVCGLALETKYTAFITAALMLLYALLNRRARFGLLAATLAGLVFALVEGLTALKYGHSHFLYQSEVYGSVNPFKKYLYLAPPLLTIAGAVFPALALNGLVALRARARTIAALAAAVACGFLLLACVPERYATLDGNFPLDEGRLTLAHFVYAFFGLLFYGMLGVVVWRLCRLRALAGWRRMGARELSARLHKYRVEYFLLLWFASEVAGYFVLSPIPAVRRFLGLQVAATLLTGRLASRTCRTPERKALLRFVACVGIALGLLFYAVDLRDARVEQLAAQHAAREVKERDATANVWYVARWGFQFYAERAGMLPVVADESEFRAGDWLVISDGHYFPQPVAAHIEKYRLQPVTQFRLRDPLPLATMLGYYNSGLPLRPHEGPRRTVQIYRIISRAESAQ